MDPITREAHYRRIRYVARAYRLQWLVDQAVFERAGIEELSDQELIKLQQDIDRARECPELDVSYEERGLLKSFG
jgi:hypothetical protein